MSKQLPQTEEEMLNIVGVTKANFDKYGKQLLDVIEGFAAVRDGNLKWHLEWSLLVSFLIMNIC